MDETRLDPATSLDLDAPAPAAVEQVQRARTAWGAGRADEAERACRQALAASPGNPHALHLLALIALAAGNFDLAVAHGREGCRSPEAPAALFADFAGICRQRGHLAEGEAAARRAVDMDPTLTGGWINLGVILLDLLKYDESRGALERALALEPRKPETHNNLANVLDRMGRLAEADRHWNALISLAPAEPRWLASRALALLALDRPDEALKTANLAVAAAPQSAEPQDALGRVLQAMNRFEPALAAFDRAAALAGPGQSEAICDRAMLLVEFGRKDEGRAAFETAIADDPRSPTLLFHYADLRRFAVDDPLIPRMERLIGPETPLGDRMMLHFALGKAYLDCGRPDDAFRHLNEGNRLKRGTFSYDAGASDRYAAAIAQTFTPAFLAARRGAGERSKLPVFVIGMPRSGTTLIEQILASHPMIQGAGELRLLQKLVDRTGSFPDFIPALPASRYAALGANYLAEATRLSEGRRRVVDKMPSNFFYAGLIPLILPDARIIHSRRDPVDTCLSCYTKHFAREVPFAYDLTELGRFHRSYQALMAHWRKVLPASRFLEVDYEAVVEDIEREARRMLNFLGLPWNDAVLRFHETQRPIRTASANQVREPLYRTSAGRWRKYADHLAPLLDALGMEAGDAKPRRG